jgi:hypothetical protein
MSDFRKPRADYPIYPSTGYYRKRAQTFKVPKGRRGIKPKGQRVGNFVKYQDPNFIFIKAEDDARKARELAIAQAKEQEQYRQLQIQDIEDEKRERERKERARQDELQIRRDELAENQKTQREQLRLQDEAQQETERYRAAKAVRARELREKEREREQRLIEDRREIAGHLTQLYEASERRAGENLEVFRTAFQAIADRRPVDFRDIKLQEQTDLSADQRRDRRGRSESFEREVSVGFESLAGTPAGRERSPTPERRQSIPIETIEQTTQKGRDVKLPKRYEGGATEQDLAAAGGIEGQTPRGGSTSNRSPTQRGGSGSEETERRGSNKGKQTFPQPEPEREEGTPVIGGGDWLKSVKLSPATKGGLTESQVEIDLGNL